MFRFLVSALAAAQLSPALLPTPAPKPTLPKIDQNACPFEGCQFGKWTARKPVRLYSTWKYPRTPVRTVEKGEVVRAVTGVNITFEPAEITVTAPIPQYGLKPGDTIFAYMNLGEGFFNAWFKGMWVEEFDGSGVAPVCNRGCNAKFVKPGRLEWWVQIRTRNGVTGWTQETDGFDGTDSLGLLLLDAPSTPL